MFSFILFNGQIALTVNELVMDEATLQTPVPEIIDLVFAKTSPKRSFCMTENERFGLVFVKTGSISSGTGPLMSVL